MRRCPACGRTKFARSRARTRAERYLLHLVLLAPFRCLKCGRRFYDLLWSRAEAVKSVRHDANPVQSAEPAVDELTFDELISDLRQAEKNMQVAEPAVERKVGG